MIIKGKKCLFKYGCDLFKFKMGQLLSTVWLRLSGAKEMKILMVGLDAAGKTTILYKLKLNELVTTIPTIGFNVDRIEYRNINFTIWDIGGQDKIRPLWRYYYEGIQAVIFVVDSSDRERMDEAAMEFKRMMNEDQLRDATVLIFANKQDLPNAITSSELTDIMGLRFLKNRNWFLQPSCAATGSGLYEGLDWLSRILTRKKN